MNEEKPFNPLVVEGGPPVFSVNNFFGADLGGMVLGIPSQMKKTSSGENRMKKF